jgi:SAM-dependent methyltransferase
MTSSILKRDLTDQWLHEIYGVLDYYWYLRSAPYVEAFLKPLANIINRLSLPCLDIGCGEGQLARYIRVPYLGFDGSSEAVQKAIKAYGSDACSFQVSRIETYENHGHWGTLVFGNILHCLIHAESQLPLIQKYLNQATEYFIIYELERFNEKDVSSRFQLVEELHASVTMREIEEVKKHRKILVYSCK